MKMKYAEKCFHTFVIASVIGFGVGFSGTAHAHSKTAQDHYTSVIQKEPYYVKVCEDVAVSGDKTGDTLKGAIIGGIIGNNVGNVENGGAIGAIIGGMIGNNNSDAKGGVVRQCRTEQRFNEVVKQVYSHSTIRFMHDGRWYTVRFQK